MHKDLWPSLVSICILYLCIICMIPSMQSLSLNCWARAIYKWSVASTKNHRKGEYGTGHVCGQAAPQGTAHTVEAGPSFLPGVRLSGDESFINLLLRIPSHFPCQIVPCRGLFAFKEIEEIQVSSLWLLSVDGFSSSLSLQMMEKKKALIVTNVSFSSQPAILPWGREAAISP